MHDLESAIKYADEVIIHDSGEVFFFRYCAGMS